MVDLHNHPEVDKLGTGIAWELVADVNSLAKVWGSLKISRLSADLVVM